MNLKPTANLVLIAPEIPQNTGNVIRLCANVGARLHLVKPLGFELENPGLRRASLDYSDLTDILVHESIDEFLQTISIDRVYAATTSGTFPLYSTTIKIWGHDCFRFRKSRITRQFRRHVEIREPCLHPHDARKS
ncbi:MAG: hypothetical protein CM1200mP35_08680 [Chloroflexota bacterium]|nr:MAG: hypothetical protein CM1200mP35_08680 [Chloroflexota bacterium]